MSNSTQTPPTVNPPPTILASCCRFPILSTAFRSFASGSFPILPRCHWGCFAQPDMITVDQNIPSLLSYSLSRPASVTFMSAPTVARNHSAPTSKKRGMSYMEYVLSMQCIYPTTYGGLPVVEPPHDILFDLVLIAHLVARCSCLSMLMACLTVLVPCCFACHIQGLHPHRCLLPIRVAWELCPRHISPRHIPPRDSVQML